MSGAIRRPDFVLKTKSKEPGGGQSQIGYGYKNADGSVGVYLDPFVVLTRDDRYYVRLFPLDYETKRVREELPTEPEPPFR